MSTDIVKTYNFNLPTQNSINKKGFIIALLEYILKSDNDQSNKLFEDVYEYLYNKYNSINNINNIDNLDNNKNNLLTVYNSRYDNDFVETSVIARGGFGLVCKAMNKLDCIEYAVKKIPIKSNNEPINITKILNEVKLLAKLNHENIIRYYSTWIDFVKDNDIYKLIHNNSNDISSSYSSSQSNIITNTNITNNNNNILVLYIQMELCSSTLKEYIASNKLKLCDIRKIMLNIAQGVEYIHSKKIIHCDLTLKNILITNNNIIKITDFGLAKELDNNQNYYIINSDYGTKTYMAPETVKLGKYSFKTDIYSLGIIYFELIHNFKTEMERSIMINKLKNRKIKDTKLDLILKMTEINEELRPNINEIINILNK